jgi:N-acetylneuraminic acid mutarotase
MQTRCPFRCFFVLLTTLSILAPYTAHAASPTAGTWTMTGAMHQARAFQTTTLLPSGQVLVSGGTGSNGFLDGAEVYHPHTGSWAGTGSMHNSRLEFTATLLHDGQVLVVGGGGTNGVLAGAELYDPRTGKWTLTGSMHTPRVYHTATLLPDGRVLVTGGVSGGCSGSACTGILAGAEIYDPRTGIWTTTGSMHQVRARQTATLLPDGQVLVAGGAAGGAETAGTDLLVSAEIYNPSTGKWKATNSMHTAAGARSATLLRNGLVLVAGGWDGSGWITDAELYHPGTGAWTVTGSLHDPRGYQTGQAATVLGNGKVLVVGGCPETCSTVLGSAELYNTHSGTWTITGSLHQPRAWHSATLLASGQVLVTGGSRTDDGSASLAGAELYQP